MQHRHMPGTVAVTQVEFEKLAGDDEAEHQVGKAARILHPSAEMHWLWDRCSCCRWSHLCCVRISPEGRSVSAGLGALPCSAQCNSLGQVLGFRCGFISCAKEKGSALEPVSFPELSLSVPAEHFRL